MKNKDKDLYVSLGSMEENEKGIALQDIHEAYQLLLKIIQARNAFSTRPNKVKNKDSAKEVSKEDVQVNVLKAASLFRKKHWTSNHTDI